MGQVEGKVTIVTGGASGIGAACATTLAREGAKLVVTDAINLDGVFLSVKYAVPTMRRAGGGSIIIMSSVAGLRGSAGLAGYCATKGGVRLFAKAVAMECAAEADGIRVNTVHPGVIDTPIWTKISGSAGRNVPIDPNEVAEAGVPLGRVGQAQDIANGVLFLASDASSYMTGAELVIDGGMTGGARPRWS
jgi:NAD(P)-dependent dehydrogenase (short-subunit alcohol dehydrogenase family)